MLTSQSDLLKELIQYRHELHQHPELAMEEYETTKRIQQWLSKAGVSIIDFGLEVGVVAEIKGHLPGELIALRADIDALPIAEQTNLPYQSTIPGKMHACGHDFHTVSMLGAAILLQQNRHQLAGTVRIIFQPSEETAQGAKYITSHGVLEGVQAIFGMHNKPDLAVGQIGIKSGPLMGSVVRFQITIKGLGGHAGLPETTIDPIVISSQLVTALQSIVSRNLSSFENGVLSVTRITGGTTWNVIPESVTLEGTVRTFQQSGQQTIEQRMRELCEYMGKAFNADISLLWEDYLPVVDNDAQFEQLMYETAQQLQYEVVTAEAVPAGEDFAFYQQQIPGYFVWLGTGGTYNWHHPQFTLQDESIEFAANYFAQLALNYPRYK